MGNEVIAQKIKKEFDNPMDIAIRYYSMLSVLNNFALTERQIQLLAHTAVKGNISTVSSKEEFIKAYKTSAATINNIISQLKKRKLLVKISKMIRVNPVINLDFNECTNFIINVNLCIKPSE